jgi:hypothetical protein
MMKLRCCADTSHFSVEGNPADVDGWAMVARTGAADDPVGAGAHCICDCHRVCAVVAAEGADLFPADSVHVRVPGDTAADERNVSDGADPGGGLQLGRVCPAHQAACAADDRDCRVGGCILRQRHAAAADGGSRRR